MNSLSVKVLDRSVLAVRPVCHALLHSALPALLKLLGFFAFTISFGSSTSTKLRCQVVSIPGQSRRIRTPGLQQRV